jgi:hypothetical protein
MKAIGRPMICSDIPVHREQAPASLGFFGCDDPRALAATMSRVWPPLAPGPDETAEAAALIAEHEFAAAHGRSLLNLCRQVMAR